MAGLQQQVAQARRRLQWLSAVRLVCFVGMLASAWQYIAKNFPAAWLLPLGILLAIFIYALAKYQREKDRLQLLQTLQEINEKELHLLSANESLFEDGSSFINEQHPFTSDLDVFGPASLYQHMNRTGTLLGREELARSLQFPLQDVASIQALQAAVRELAPRVEFRQLLTAHAMLAKEAPGDRVALHKWLQLPVAFLDKRWLRLLSWISPACLLACIILYIYTGQYYPATLFLVINWGILGISAKKIKEQHEHLGSKEQILRKFGLLLHLVKKEPLEAAALLKAQQEQAAVADVALHRLARISNALDQNLNLIVGVFLNSIVLYGIHCVFSLDKWKMQHRHQVEGWLQVIARMEAWNSLATFAFNHPGYVFPELNDHQGLKAEAVGHPLIPAGECVTNSIAIGHPQHYLIITGSNMSGKSTFLRSVGSNLLLAMCGAPVCAAAFSCTPLYIMTSMRIKDSIARHTSYFQAELLRLQEIVKALQTGRPVFILLDEILKGTNSADKLTGSRQLITHLLQYNCMGVIATHDLELGQLEQAHPQRIKNYCFESTIEQNHLYFDYRIREGIAHNKNATFLMQQMGII
ncbi:MutS family DNA mismatch repair protein [Chitinophaga japonensis]